MFLCRWWSLQYKRPLKDPILSSYTTEELLYEYYSHIEHIKYEAERAEEAADKIEEAKLEAAEDWADKMEEEESKTQQDPAQDPNNKKWMEEQMKIDQEMLGDDFGKDLDIDFSS